MSTAWMIESAEHRKRLFSYARAVAECRLAARPAPADRPRLSGRFGGAFVSLWNGASLRGCIGTFQPTSDITATVAEVMLATLRDPRFAAAPVTAPEFASLRVDISLLSEPLLMRSLAELTPGVHGVIVQRDNRSGCFLPKVALDRGWDAETLLSICCSLKAGLPADAWRDPDTRIFLFTADVISEKPATC